MVEVDDKQHLPLLRADSERILDDAPFGSSAQQTASSGLRESIGASQEPPDSRSLHPSCIFFTGVSSVAKLVRRADHAHTWRSRMLESARLAAVLHLESYRVMRFHPGFEPVLLMSITESCQRTRPGSIQLPSALVLLSCLGPGLVFLVDEGNVTSQRLILSRALLYQMGYGLAETIISFSGLSLIP
jgi:hypothetical protein